MKNMRIVLGLLFLGFLAVPLTACGSKGSSSPAAVILLSISVTPTNPVIPLAATQQFRATGAYSNGTSQDLTTQVTWSSSNPSVATVTSGGLAAAVAAGTATISASAINIVATGSISGSTTLTVTSATLSSISVTPANLTIPLRFTPQFAAVGTYSDGTSLDLTTQVTWSSSNPSVATVTSGGLATAIAAGTAIITATSGSISGSSTLTVTSATLTSLSVTPGNPSLPAGVILQFTATGAFSDGTSHDMTTQVTWSSNASVATINNSGLAIAVGGGGTIITATSGSISGSTTLSVTPGALSSIFVTPVNPSMPLGVILRFTAIGSYSDGTSHDISTQVIWSSSNTAVATVNGSGLAIAVATGTSTITATAGGISGSTALAVTSATLSSISVTPTNPSKPAGVLQQFIATGAYSDGTGHDITTQVSWASSNSSVARVTSGGLATAIAAGTSTITATSGGISGSTALAVTSATLSSISVTPTNPILPVGVTQQFRATGAYSDGTSLDITTQVTWGSSNAPVATVTSRGLATAIAAGPSTITATSGGISGSTALAVTAVTLSTISVTPANSSVSSGLTLQFTATGAYSDGTSHDITTQVSWASSNSSVARVTSEGLATAGIGGTVVITALSGSILGQTHLTVR